MKARKKERSSQSIQVVNKHPSICRSHSIREIDRVGRKEGRKEGRKQGRKGGNTCKEALID